MKELHESKGYIPSRNLFERAQKHFDSIKKKKLDDQLKSRDLPGVLELIQSGKALSVKIRKKALVKSYALACCEKFLELYNN